MISYEERERMRARATSRWARLTGLTLSGDVLRLLDEVEDTHSFYDVAMRAWADWGEG